MKLCRDSVVERSDVTSDRSQVSASPWRDQIQYRAPINDIFTKEDFMPNGRGMGQGAGQGGRGRMGGFGAGPQGECVCPKCDQKAPHQIGIPCYEQTCPKCGEKMTRE